MRIRICKENEGQKCAETTMKDGWADSGNGSSSTFVSSPSFGHESVSNMGGVIDAKSNRQYQIDTRYSVDCKTPKVHSSVHTYLKKKRKNTVSFMLNR